MIRRVLNTPGLVKISYTSQDDANSRIAQLYTTGVPVSDAIDFREYC